jgi:integrase
MVHIHKSGVRDRLKARKEPYWTRIQRGQYIGFRKLDDGSGTWIARRRTDEGGHEYKSLGYESPTLDFDAAKAAAEQWFKHREADIKDDEVVTVADACRRYVQDLISAGRTQTAHDAHKRFERTVYGRLATTDTYRPQKALPANPLAKRKLVKLRTAHLKEWREGLDQAAGTSNRNVTALKAALNLAVSERNCPASQAQEWAELEQLDHEAKQRPFLDKHQRRAWLDAAAEGAVRDLIEGACLTGARPGELVNARVKQYDRRTQSMTWKGKTGTRTVPVSDEAAVLLNRLSKSKLPTAYLFTRDGGQKWGPSDWDEKVKQAARDAQIDVAEDVVLYCGRHAWITEALLSGMTTLDVSKLTGTSISQIEATYGHLVVTSARERLAKVEML